MCGICGTVGNPNAHQNLAIALERMAHRGPDQQGQVAVNQVTLGHRRLAIIDLSDQGRQPLTNEDGTIWLVFNGEIYNFADLRDRLEPYHRFRSHTDSEVLIHGYEQWGIDGLLRRVRGMFAFALWDEAQGILHLGRDHVGKKPLYYSSLGGGLTFASTLPALVELLGTTPAVSATAVLDYLTYLCVPAPQSIFEGVAKLPPAHRLEYRPGQPIQLVRYWQPDYAYSEQHTEAEWLDQLEATLKQAVVDRMVADVPIGAFLSGGVDSSLIVALMASQSSRPIKTISVGFSQASFNELPYARQVAERYGCDHSEHILQPNATAVLPALVAHFGEPFADHSALPMYYLAEAARTQVTVVLTGDGGDETFAGYKHLPAVRLAQGLHRLPSALKVAVAARLRELEDRGVRGVRKFRWIAETAQGRKGTYVFDPVSGRTCRDYRAQMLGPLLQKGADHSSDALYTDLWQNSDLTNWVDRALCIDLLTLLPDDLLTKVDVTTMAHGLEARSPFLDLRLVELSAKIPARLKLKNLQTKHLLKRLAIKYLPKEVLYRPKQGFSPPTSHWLRDDLGPELRAILLSKASRQRGYIAPEVTTLLLDEHQRGKADHGQRLWSLLMLELWFQMFIDKTLSPSDGLGLPLSTPQRFEQVLV
ncbi:MAG TPA: asparagine synthase (glutamine-hydrolyzing) [Nodosilinea sp.]|nr:asparagine synthase (glutamine-hydrolyzing) [Nodosilinea sp.]